MMVKKVCLLLELFQGTNLNSLLFLKMSLQTGRYCILFYITNLFYIYDLKINLMNIIIFSNNGNASPGSPDNDKKRIRRSYQSKTFKVELSFAAKIPMQAIAQALRGQESENSMEALRVLDIILRQHAAKQ